MQELVYLNGWVGPFAGAFISVNDRGYIFGDGVYEVIRAYNGKMFALEDHLNRLQSSAAAVELNLPGNVQKIGLLCEDLLKKSQIKEAIVYMQITRGTAPRNHFFDPGIKPNLLITVRHLPEIPSTLYSKGIKVTTQPDFRWHMCNVKSISLQANVLAKHKARKVGAMEAVFTLPDGTVTECGSSNIFMFKNGILKTHPEGNKILSGITRKYIIKVAKSLNMDIREEPFTVTDLLDAEEALCTNTVEEVMPVIKVDDKIIGSGRPGPVTTRLHEEFKALRQG